MKSIPQWLRLALLLSVFGFLKEFRPSEPYIYDYLTGPWRNISGTVVSQDVYPIATYSQLSLAVVVFLITDLCRYKPLITLLAISGVIIYAMLIWTTSLVALQILEVFYGFFSAAEVAYYTYIYAKVPKENYQAVTSCTRTGILLGRFTGATVAQILLLVHLMNYKSLNYLTFSAMIVATFWSFLLPSVPQSLYFNRKVGENASFGRKFELAWILIWEHTKGAYKQMHVIKWSIWWALAMCGFLQVESYMQTLYAAILTDQYQGNSNIYNGGVTAIVTIMGVIMSTVAGLWKVNWEKYGETALGLCSIIGGTSLVFCGTTAIIWVCYGGYILYGMTYQFMITVANFQVALKIPDDSYGLVFGINTLMALVFQTLLTVIVVEPQFLGFGPRHAYQVYGGYHIIMGLVFIVAVIYKLIKYWNKSPVTVTEFSSSDKLNEA